jgi:lipase chaperone LimK
LKRIVLALATVLGLGWWYTSQGPQPVAVLENQITTQPRGVIPTQQISDVVQHNELAAQAKLNMEQLPASLRGAPLPQPLVVDGQGQLVIDLQLRKLFDYYLTAIGEEPLSDIVARIRHQLQSQLTDEALDQALDILDGYLQYRNALAAILSEGNGQEAGSAVEQVRLVRQQMIDVRHQYLSAQVIEAFFARSDQYDSYMLARQAVSQNQQLSPLQKRQALKELQDSAPQWLQLQQTSSNQLSHFHQQQRQLKAEGGDEAQLQQLRESTFGVEAADRLAALAEKRRVWRDKLVQYHQQIKPLLNNGLTGEDLDAQVKLLRQQYFDSAQLVRVAAIDSQKFGW